MKQEQPSIQTTAKQNAIVYLLRNCVRPPDLDKLMQDAADLIQSMSADIEGAAHNRFYDQADAHWQGVKDERNAN